MLTGGSADDGGMDGGSEQREETVASTARSDAKIKTAASYLMTALPGNTTAPPAGRDCNYT